MPPVAVHVINSFQSSEIVLYGTLQDADWVHTSGGRYGASYDTLIGRYRFNKDDDSKVGEFSLGKLYLLERIFGEVNKKNIGVFPFIKVRIQKGLLGWEWIKSQEFLTHLD